MLEVVGAYHHGGGGVMLEVVGACHHGGGGVMLEVVGAYHHGGGLQGVARPSEVMPLDAVELPDVMADGVINPVQVGETTGVKPPA